MHDDSGSYIDIRLDTALNSWLMGAFFKAYPSLWYKQKSSWIMVYSIKSVLPNVIILKQSFHSSFTDIVGIPGNSLRFIVELKNKFMNAFNVAHTFNATRRPWKCIAGNFARRRRRLRDAPHWNEITNNVQRD